MGKADRLIPRMVLLAALVMTAAHAEGADGTTLNSPGAALSPFIAWPLRVLGGVLIIYGLFAVPGDQKKYESYLVRWWVWVEERREAGLKWQTAFLQVLVSVLAGGFVRLFGHRLLSLRAMAASILLTFASMFFIAAGMYVYLGDPTSLPLRIWSVDVFIKVLIAVPIGVLIVLMVVRGWIKLMLVSTILLLVLLFIVDVRLSYGPQNILTFPILWLALVGSFASDILFVAATRWMLAFSRSLTSATAIVGLILLNVAGAGTLILIPFEIGFRWGPRESVGQLARFIVMFNAFDGLVAVSTVALGLVMLAHRAIWPIIGRPLEVISSEHILLKRWPLFFTGVSLLGVSWTPFGAWLKLLQGK